MAKIKVGIAGYGNLGRGVELALQQNEDMELAGIFTRRDPKSLVPQTPGAKVFAMADAASMQAEIDVMILCGGSATDLPEQGPQLAQYFNTIDSFDTHAKIPQHFAAVDAAAARSGHVAIISVGWDPGLFSLNRLIGEASLPQGASYTFWGRGVSQGHSDAIRRVPGVKDAKQYTVPVQSAIDRIRGGETPAFTTREKHLRECFVVLQPGADAAAVEKAIKEMPNYFADYDTTVHFISEEELRRDHAAMPHGGFVIRSGQTGKGTRQVMEFSLKLESNPEFTSSVLVAYARAAYRLAKEGQSGAKTVLDIPPAYLSSKSSEALRAELL